MSKSLVAPTKLFIETKKDQMQNNMLRDTHFHVAGNVSYIKIGMIILSRWYWIAGFLLFGLLAGTVYIQYQQKLYAASASVKVEEKRSELSELINIRNIYDRTNKAESERFILKSRNVLQKALVSIGQDIVYFRKEKFRLVDIYPEKPLRIIRKDRETQRSADFEFHYVDNRSYSLSFLNEGKKISKHFEFGKMIRPNNFYFKIERPETPVKCVFRFNATENSLQKLIRELSIDETQNTNIINLKITTANPYFARDILNAILDQYVQFDKSERAASVIQTEIFIGSLLSTMSEAVKLSGEAIQEFKRDKGLINISSALNTSSNLLTELESQKHALDIQAIMIAEFGKRLNTPGETDALNYGPQDISDPQLNVLLSRFNDLSIKKKQLLNFYTPNAPEIRRANEEANTFIQAIRKNISSKLNNNARTGTLLNIRIDSIHKALTALPRTEQELIHLQSRFDVDQKIYNYLSEKQLEAQISRAAVTSGAVVIDRAVLPAEAISPLPPRVYTSSAVISIILGTGLIFLLRVLNPHIYTRHDIETYTDVPILGLIRRHSRKEKKEKIALMDDLRSTFAESVRSVRSNLSFLASGEKSKVICITSEISGEGKSFASLNIAASLTLVEKRVLLVVTDMRKSKLHHIFHLSNHTGLSQYLSDQNELESIVKQTNLPGLDFIPSGPVPPNPAELLHGSKMELLLKKMKNKYDFIILDSAPVGLVTDGKPLIKIADINLFILRYGVSRHDFALRPETLQKELNLSNFAILLNDYREDRYHHNFYQYPDQTYNVYNQDYFQS